MAMSCSETQSFQWRPGRVSHGSWQKSRRRRWLQDYRRKRGQREADGELAVMPVDLLGVHDARRGLGGEAAISFGVAVEQQGVGDG